MINFDSSELRKRVDEILYYIWDPIGVSTCASARGEYWNYVDQILELLEQNEGIDEISERLEFIRVEWMGLPVNKKRSDFAAGILQDHKKAIKGGQA